MYSYIFIGVALLVIGIIFFDLKSVTNSYGTDKSWSSSYKNHQKENRDLKLVVAYDFGQRIETISEKATVEQIKKTMESINWNEFHIVQLEDEKENALHVSGSLTEDGFSSGYVTTDNHILLVNPPTSVKEMTEILIEFLKGEENWRSKYEYK